MIDTDENLYKKVISWLKKNKINYTIEESSMYTTVKLFRGATGSVELIFNPSMFVAQSLPRCARPSHAAEGSMFYVKVGDWGKWINEFIAWAKERGYHECNNYHCAQWGTWKFNNFISYSFLNVFLKKILTMSGQMNESMQLDEAKQILKENGFMLKERFVNVDEIHVPEWLWVAYETGDTSNLKDEEIMILHIFEKDHKNHILEANEEPNFYRTNDVTDEGGMCYTVQVFEDRLVEDYNFYRNPFYQMNQKRIRERNQLKKELIDEIIANSNWTEDDRETLMDFDVRKLKMLLNGLGV